MEVDGVEQASSCSPSIRGPTAESVYAKELFDYPAQSTYSTQQDRRLLFLAERGPVPTKAYQQLLRAVESSPVFRKADKGDVARDPFRIMVDMHGSIDDAELPRPHANGRAIGVPRSATTGSERSGLMRQAAREAVAEAYAAKADSQARVDKLRKELDARWAEDARRRAEVEAERRRREQAAQHQRKVCEELSQTHRARTECEAREKVDRFLSANGFVNVREGCRKRLRTTYPLHAAVLQNDAELVLLLLQAGANPLQRDSSRRTPLELVRKCNKKGSHDNVLSILAAL